MLVILLLVIMLSLPLPAKAANYHLSISPPVLEIITQPHKSFIQTFTLKNQASNPATLVPKIIAVKPLDNQGHVTLDNLQPATNLPFRFSLENANLQLNQPFTLPPHQTQQLVLRFTAASTNQSQDFYLALALVPPNQTTSQPLSQPVLTSLLLITLTPDGNLPIDLQLQNFNPPPLHDSSVPLQLQPQLRNNSPIMIRPQPHLTIKNWRGRTLLDTDLAPDLILGHTNRQLRLPSSNTISWQPPKLALGPHQITLTVTTQTGKPLIQETKTVFLAPLQYLVYFILTLISLTLLLIYHHPSQPNKTPPPSLRHQPK